MSGKKKELNKLKVDVIVFSPPYSEIELEDFSTDKYHSGGDTKYLTTKKGDDIRNLKHGKIDAIIFSPPYAEVQEGGGIAKKGYQGDKHSETDLIGKRSYMPTNIGDKQNISNKPYGEVDAIVPDGSTSNEVEEGQVGNVLFFKPTPGFQGYKQFFHIESVTHPAKANLNMLRWIIERYTKEGDVVLDPMAGTGSTGIIACYLNRKAILIDLEQKFVDMMRKNIERFKKACKFWKVKRPIPVTIQGDSRQLSNMLRKVDSIIFSPPFSESDTAFHDQKDEWVAKKTKALEKVSNSKENIATLKHGEIDTIITSPPYSDAFNEKKHTLSGIARRDPNFRREVGGYGEGNKQIANLPHGKIDAIITSPPYEASTKHAKMDRINIEKHIYQHAGYSEDKENMGNQKGETYLSAMLKVYRECWKVLKPNGKMVIIVKNFIRNKKIVRLDLDTIKLCEKAGFQLVERWYSQLKQQSFWRIIYMKKYPSVPKIHYEHILVFQKER